MGSSIVHVSREPDNVADILVMDKLKWSSSSLGQDHLLARLQGCGAIWNNQSIGISLAITFHVAVEVSNCCFNQFTWALQKYRLFTSLCLTIFCVRSPIATHRRIQQLPVLKRAIDPLDLAAQADWHVF